jgi:hypothetical protein
MINGALSHNVEPRSKHEKGRNERDRSIAFVLRASSFKVLLQRAGENFVTSWMRSYNQAGNTPVVPGADPMSEGSSPLDWTLPLSQAERVDEICDAFERAWKTFGDAPSTGQRPKIEDHLEGVSNEGMGVLFSG